MFALVISFVSRPGGVEKCLAHTHGGQEDLGEALVGFSLASIVFECGRK